METYCDCDANITSVILILLYSDKLRLFIQMLWGRNKGCICLLFMVRLTCMGPRAKLILNHTSIPPPHPVFLLYALCILSSQVWKVNRCIFSKMHRTNVDLTRCASTKINKNYKKWGQKSRRMDSVSSKAVMALHSFLQKKC